MGLSGDDITPYLFIKHVDNEFVMVAIYVDNINIFCILTIIENIIKTHKNTFEMKDLGTTKFCIGL